MKLSLVLLCTLLLVVYVESKGARGGGARSSSRSSNSRSSSRSTASSKRGSRYYSGASYSRSTVLTYMTLFAFSGYGYNRASYYRYNKDTPEYCVYCNATMSNDTCTETFKTVCKQSSDCFYMSFKDPANSTAAPLIQKGCLYESYGQDGCAAQEASCAAAGNVNCTCNFCTEPFCNRAGHVTYSVAGLVVAVIFSFFLARRV